MARDDTVRDPNRQALGDVYSRATETDGMQANER
jgi:hypothetical protein